MVESPEPPVVAVPPVTHECGVCLPVAPGAAQCEVASWVEGTVVADATAVTHPRQPGMPVLMPSMWPRGEQKLCGPGACEERFEGGAAGRWSGILRTSDAFVVSALFSWQTSTVACRALP